MKRLAAFAAALLLAAFLSAGAVSAQDVKALVDQGLVYCEQGKFDQAIDNFTQALKAKPNDPQLYTYRGRAKWAKGANTQALADYDQALKIDPKFGWAYNNRALVYYNMEDFQKALEELRQAQAAGYKVDPEFVKMVERRAQTKRK
jgi:tetratricopeptide (TPR) repeat protein